MRTAARTLIAVALFLGACSTPPPRPTFPDIRFTEEKPIALDVARIEIVNAYRAPFKAPYVDQLFPVMPEHAMENWARDRLRAVGSGGRAVFTIKNASVVETSLKTKQGLTGAFTDQPAERYDLTLQANLQVIDQSGLSSRTASVTTTRSQTLLESITPNDRDRAFYAMTKAAMADFDRQMTSEIRNNFGTFAH